MGAVVLDCGPQELVFNEDVEFGAPVTYSENVVISPLMLALVKGVPGVRHGYVISSNTT